MIAAELADPTDLKAWKGLARALLAAGVPPAEVTWRDAGDPVADLFAGPLPPPAPADYRPPVPRAFVALAEMVLRHRSAERLDLLYRLLWRLAATGERSLLAVRSDPDVARAAALEKQVRRDAYHMKAYLRFREVAGEDGALHYVAWFEPDHRVTELAAPHFTQRFATMRWSILTPDRSAHWDGAALRFDTGAAKADVPTEDALASYWKTYYSSIFNPARLKVDAMLAQMPRKYWKNLGEGEIIDGMVAAAAARVQGMVAAGPTAPARKGRVAAERVEPVVASAHTLDGLRQEIHTCRACPLWQPATQAVPGEGSAAARLMLVGEQPGDQEDLTGRPFVGPAGQALDAALAAAGLDRELLYITSAVKHFKFEPRGKRRVHQRASSREAAVCGGWLEREVELVKPDLIVAMGATAARALLGRDVAVMQERRRVIEHGWRRVLVTVHPAAALRQQDADAAQRYAEALAADLALAARLLAGQAA
ncbi:UdgX family uracil-DNA binding protein [Caenispirillum bisanense]|uniref:Type-4 uracil-DNA glycosylase n=1 Tax=Caenispirillum bisanense TaxID=414052 RepID=A0A286GZT1_9PROT|nr:UdgX family uracil-DNA binding protein [Caenispirillum bisanense]SOE00972.1 DNA polymerase [Caenispirillum bisanense]